MARSKYEVCADFRVRGWLLSLAVAVAAMLTAVAAPASAPASGDLQKHAPAAVSPAGAVLTTAGAVHSLPDEEAGRARPVKLRAVVTFYDPRAPESHTTASLFVHDATGGVWVRVPARPVLQLREGTLVEVTGVSGAGNYAPIVTQASIRILGQSVTPANPPRVSLTDMATGKWDCRWVEVEGTVHTATRVGRMESLRLATRGGTLVALTLAQDGVDYSRWIDAQVILRGVSAPEYNKHRQMTGVHLFFPAPDDLQIVKPARLSAFLLPRRPINQLAQFDPHATSSDRVHIAGRVTLDWPGRMLCLEDATGGLCVERGSADPLAIGRLVDVVGYPLFAAEVPALIDATVQAASNERVLPSSQRSAPSEVFEGQHSGELLDLEGEVVGVGSDGQDWMLTMLSQGVVFTAVLPQSYGEGGREVWQQGSYVRVRGVCVSEMEMTAEDWSSLQRLRSFRILMRSDADVMLLKKPSWWTQTHTVEVFSVGVVVTLAGFGWVLLLRRRVEVKTRELRESEERFRHLAHHDPLTCVPNRAKFYQCAGSAIEHARRSGNFVGMMLLDMDNFKPINDRLGHEAGDRVLCALTERVAGALRKVDTVARLGGDEFAVVLCDLNQPGDAEVVAEKVLRAVCHPLLIDGEQVPISVSIGVCVYPEDGGNVQELLQKADETMYESKRAKRGSLQRYQAPLLNLSEAGLIVTAALS